MTAFEKLKSRIEGMKEKVLPAKNYVFGDLNVGNIEAKNRIIDEVLEIVSEIEAEERN